MVARIRRKRSKAAKWCYRIATFSIVYFAVAIILHRFGPITTPQIFWLLTAGLILICVSLVLAIKAFYDLWNHGYQGGVPAVRGTIMSLAMFFPFIYFGFLGLSLPLVNDVSSDVFNPPDFITVEDERIDKQDKGISQLSEYTPDYGETLIRAYPKLGSRRYAADQERVYKAAVEAIKSQGWKIREVEGEPIAGDVDGAGEEEPKLDGGKQEDGDAANDDAPEGEGEDAEEADNQEILIEGETTSLIVGYKGDFVVRIANEKQDTLVDMRSASRWGRHDFGNNAKIIMKFMNVLDEKLLGIAGEG